ncbi:hypothetical protein LOZ53_006083, partial [Ophidiomyces ophidiicola]
CKGSTVGKPFLNDPIVVYKELLTTKQMHFVDFKCVMNNVIQAVNDGQVDAASKNEYAADCLRKFDPTYTPETPENIRLLERSACEIYLVKVESQWPDQVWEQQEPGSCIIN